MMDTNSSPLRRRCRRKALGWSGLLAPAAPPPHIIRRINADAVAILRDPAVAARMVELGGFADPDMPEQFARFIRDEISKRHKIARAVRRALEGLGMAACRSPAGPR